MLIGYVTLGLFRPELFRDVGGSRPVVSVLTRVNKRGTLKQDGASDLQKEHSDMSSNSQLIGSSEVCVGGRGLTDSTGEVLTASPRLRHTVGRRDKECVRAALRLRGKKSHQQNLHRQQVLMFYYTSSNKTLILSCFCFLIGFYFSSK